MKRSSHCDPEPSTGSKLVEEIQSFAGVWRDGYYEGNPEDPLSYSSYGQYGYLSCLHVVYLVCIKPYINERINALEIGPGRGAWTRTMLGARSIWCLDAKSKEANGIERYLGSPPNLDYHQVSDFSCSCLPDDYFDFVFSFGALCHVSWEGNCEYAARLFPKLKSGANLFLMVGDYDKYNSLIRQRYAFDITRRLAGARRVKVFEKLLHRLAPRYAETALGGLRFDPSARKSAEIDFGIGIRPLNTRLVTQDKGESDEPRAGRWYHAGANRTAQMYADLGYVVKSPDLGLLHRDPILHLLKP